VVLASSYGFDPDDSTDALQAALDSTASTVIFDNVGADWITRPLSVNRDNFTLIVERGVTVRAKPGGFPGTSNRLMRIVNHSDITISGYGAIFAMNKPEYTTGEHRTGLFLINASNIVVEGLTIRDTGGDGIYIGNSGVYPSETPYCQNVTLRDVTCDNARRNGLSVTSVDGLTVTGSKFVNTTGTNPQVGIDLEPSLSTHRLANVEIRDCVLVGNNHFELAVQLGRLDADSYPVSVLLERVYFGPQLYYSPNVCVYGNNVSDPGGLVELRDTLSNTTTSSGSLGLFNRRAEGTELLLTRTTWWNIGNELHTYSPIELYTGKTPPPPLTGGVRWTDSSMITDQDVPVIAAVSLPEGTIAANLHGNITIADPNGVTVDLGEETQDVDLQVRALANAPETVVNVTTSTSSVSAGDEAQLTFTRSSSDLVAPLSILFSTSGDAIEQDDYAGLAGFALIPPGADTVTVPVQTRSNGLDHARTINVAIEPGVGYGVGASPGTTITIRPTASRLF
jgi:hypothetical protein